MTSIFRARRLGALAAALAATAFALPTPTASARLTDLVCNYDGVSFNACLHFTPAGFGYYDGHVGMELYMPAQYSREVLACGANFQASLWGEDGASDQFIRPLLIQPGHPALITGRDGITAGWTTSRIGPQLDEDAGEARDEIYARISYIDCHRPGQVQTINTSVTVGDFRYTGF